MGEGVKTRRDVANEWCTATRWVIDWGRSLTTDCELMLEPKPTLAASFVRNRLSMGTASNDRTPLIRHCASRAAVSGKANARVVVIAKFPTIAVSLKHGQHRQNMRVGRTLVTSADAMRGVPALRPHCCTAQSLYSVSWSPPKDETSTSPKTVLGSRWCPRR